MRTNLTSWRTCGTPSAFALALTSAASLVFLLATAAAVPRVVFVVEDATGTPLIGGESIDPLYPGWIDAIALGTGFEKLSNSGAHAARRARLVVPDSFVITKKPDKASPQLQEAMFRGDEFPVVRAKYLTDAPPPEGEPIMIELRRVSVVEYEVGNGRDDPAFEDAPPADVPTELVSLSFKEIRWIYRFVDPTTGGEVEEESRWDVFYTTSSPGEDSDGDGIPNEADPDDDNDGIPDNDELANFLNPLVNDTLFDFDGDDDLNIDEVMRGTNPNSGHSFFGIDSLSLRDDPGGLVLSVSVPIIGGRLYRVLGSFDVQDTGSWIVLGEFPVPPGFPAQLGELELPPGAVPPAGRMFFRVSTSGDDA